MPSCGFARGKRIARAALIAAGAWIGVGAAIPYLVLRARPSTIGIGPLLAGLPVVNVVFRSADGVRLRGWLIPAHTPARGVVVLCHGVDGTREMMLGTARVLHRAGYACLLFDFRARGESGGTNCTLGLREASDAEAAIDYVQGRSDLARVPIAILGKSEGAAVAIVVAQRRPEVAAVVAESAFSRLDRAIDNHFRRILGPLHFLLSVQARTVGERIIGGSATSVSPEGAMARMGACPVLLIQDGDDRLCPPSESARLLRASGGRAQLWTVPGAGHVEAEVTAPREYARRVVAFLDRAMPPAVHTAAMAPGARP